jgi:Uma2 family endonuclease
MSRQSAKNELAPPLESGDHLTRSEFERRYGARPDIKKAELIEGIVYVPSPTRYSRHGKPHAHILTWLGHYEARTPGVESCDNVTLRMDLDNEPQPDAILRIRDDAGGRSRVDADDYLAGSPELVVEIAASSASQDLGMKKDAYRRNGIQEYLVWRVLDGAIDWFRLTEAAYERVVPSDEGLLRSAVFPGLWLDPVALLEGRMIRVLEVLERGLAATGHAEFVTRLERGR